MRVKALHQPGPLKQATLASHCIRWFRLQDVQPVPQAQFLDCILYSREQLLKEYEAMPQKSKSSELPQVIGAMQAHYLCLKGRS